MQTDRFDEDSAATGPARPRYAAPALGDVSQLESREAPPLPPPVVVMNHYHVTNLATLLDVLA